jgi:hypothetical protein
MTGSSVKPHRLAELTTKLFDALRVLNRVPEKFSAQ